MAKKNQKGRKRNNKDQISHQSKIKTPGYMNLLGAGAKRGKGGVGLGTRGGETVIRFLSSLGREYRH